MVVTAYCYTGRPTCTLYLTDGYTSVHNIVGLCTSYLKNSYIIGLLIYPTYAPASS